MPNIILGPLIMHYALASGELAAVDVFRVMKNFEEDKETGDCDVTQEAGCKRHSNGSCRWFNGPGCR
jgi:hypothetical protein